MRIVLDTGVFYHPEALRRAAMTMGQVVVPSVVFMERAWQLGRDGRDPAEFARRLAEDGYVIEAFREPQALRYAAKISDETVWRKHYRDAMIAGHVETSDELWTTNRRDFEKIGVPSKSIVDPR